MSYDKTLERRPKRQNLQEATPGYTVVVHTTPPAADFKNAECHYCHKRGHIAAMCCQKLMRQSICDSGGADVCPSLLRYLSSLFLPFPEIATTCEPCHMSESPLQVGVTTSFHQKCDK